MACTTEEQGVVYPRKKKNHQRIVDLHIYLALITTIR